MSMKTSTLKQIALSLLVILAAAGPCASASFATDPHCPIDWSQFHLSQQQQQQLAVLDGQWDRSYNQIKPEMVADQNRLSDLLADTKSDPLEVVSLQQSIARKKEQLRSLATSIYLRKRQILNQEQQLQLEECMRQYMDAKRRQQSGGSQTDAMPDGVNNLINKVRNMWSKTGAP